MRMSMSGVASAALVAAALVAPSRAWTPPSRLAAATNTRLFSTPEDGSASKQSSQEDEEARRMALVRSLQMTFYRPSAPTGGNVPDDAGNDDADGVGAPWDALPPSQLDPHTGTVRRLPLWRPGWSEVPGRSNVLNVHDPIYVNMFEKILYGAGDMPMYFGHLYLPNGSSNLKRDAGEPFRLKTWQAESESDETSSDVDRSAVLGCLMKIADYRRLADGRLLLLVHATERFVVTNVHQELPYSVADVQLLPDDEERDFVADRVQDEASASAVRAISVQESLRHHAFEYDSEHSLPVPPSASVTLTLTLTDVLGTAIRKVLPFVPFSSTEAVPAVEDMDVAILASPSERVTDESLETQLLDNQILYEPRAHPELLYHSDSTEDVVRDECDELEFKLWLSLNEWLVGDRVAVSPILLGLIPKHVQWPSNFALQTVNNGLGSVLDKLRDVPSLKSDFVSVPSDYPKHRRQRRLSYAAAHLLERNMTNGDDKISLRQSLLAAPSTEARLRLVLERFGIQRGCGKFE